MVSRTKARSNRIFWAEDTADDQVLIRASIRGINPAPDITFFSDGQALLEAVAHSKPDRVVLDIRMPRLDGIQTLHAIRQRPGMRATPVVMFSTGIREDELAFCKTLEVQAFVQKPLEFDEFTAAVINIVSGQAETRWSSSGRRGPLVA